MSGPSRQDASDDFFQSFGAAAASSTNINSSSRPTVVDASTTTRRKAPPPPPPRRTATATTTSRPTAGRAASRPTPPVATAATTSRATATSARPVLASRRPASNTGMASTTTSSSYYGASAAATSRTSRTSRTAAAANPYAASRVAAPSAHTFYQAPAAEERKTTAPAAAYNPNGGNPLQFQAPSQTAQGYPPQSQSAPGFPQSQPQQQPQQPQQQQQPFAAAYRGTSEGTLEGAMDEGAAPAAPKPNVFVPLAHSASSSSLGGYYEDPDELPLLEELGINPEHIWIKTKAVVLPSTRIWGSSAVLLDPNLIVGDADLAGPAAIALLLGGELLLTGKIQFGYIYGFGLFGCLAMTLVINLMSPLQAVSVWTVTSILGYALLPVNLLAALKIVLSLAHLHSLIQLLAVLTIVWSTVASTRLLEVGCQLRNQRYLLAYPLSLLYSAFVLITIF